MRGRVEHPRRKQPPPDGGERHRKRLLATRPPPIELAIAIVVLILAIAYLAGQSDRFPIAILAVLTLIGYTEWRAISRKI